VIERLLSVVIDVVTIMRMEPCDIFICMSGIFLFAPRFARWRYGARIILHRGSRHILSQQKILSEESGINPITSFMIRRELEGYTTADRIAVPSAHVAQSFAAWPELASKLFVSPYGVDLDQFPLRTIDPQSDPTLLFVGHWSYRKGVDILTTAVKGIERVRLVHVGPLLDAPFPEDERFEHHEPVPQWELKNFYAAAHVFVLASREEGLAVVQCQALACGLRLVCTDRTGGADLGALPGFEGLVCVVPVGDPEALRGALAEALDDAVRNIGVPSLTEAERQMLSWRRYAIQHLELMNDLLRL